MNLKQILEKYGFSNQKAEQIINLFTLEKYNPNELIIREGELPVKFYFISSGYILVLKRNQNGDDEPIKVLKEGHFFGEIGLLEKIERTASIQALSKVELFVLDQKNFNNLLAIDENFASFLKEIGKARLLSSIALFKDIDEKDLFIIQTKFDRKDVKKNHIIFSENEVSDKLYIIIKGHALVTKKTNVGKNIPLAMLGPGELFGEMGLLDGLNRSATIKARDDVKLLEMTKENFEEMVKNNPIITLTIAKILSYKLRKIDDVFVNQQKISFFKGMTIVTRNDRCLSCKSCEIACAVSKSISKNLYEAISEKPPPIRRIRVRKYLNGSQPMLRPEYCYHCKNASCLRVCKFMAIKKDPVSGTILMLEEKCRGCGLCVKACPFNVITLVEYENRKKVTVKCTYCVEHEDGPACVRNCPTNALVISLATNSKKRLGESNG